MDYNKSVAKMKKGQAFLMMFIFIALVLVAIAVQKSETSTTSQTFSWFFIENIDREIKNGFLTAFSFENSDEKVRNLTYFLVENNTSPIKIKIIYGYVKRNESVIVLGNFYGSPIDFLVKNNYSTGSEEFSNHTENDNFVPLTITKGEYNVIDIVTNVKNFTIVSDDSFDISGFIFLEFEKDNDRIFKYHEFNYTIRGLK